MNEPKSLYNNICTMCKCIPPNDNIVVSLLDSKQIPKFTSKLALPSPMPKLSNHYVIGVGKAKQQILPLYDITGRPTGYGPTEIFGYGTNGTYSYPSNTIEANWGESYTIKWTNNLVDKNNNYIPHILPIDQTLHWANPAGGYEKRDTDMNTSRENYCGPIPVVPHVHGLNSFAHSDGYTESWYLPKANNIPPSYAKVGSKYEYFRREYFKQFHNDVGWEDGSITYYYENKDSDGIYWYHDHALGLTRVNVYAGTAGFYLLRNNPNCVITDSRTGLPAILPSNKLEHNHYHDDKELQLAIADRSFNLDCSLFFPNSRAYFDGKDNSEWNFTTYPTLFNQKTGEKKEPDLMDMGNNNNGGHENHNMNEMGGMDSMNGMDGMSGMSGMDSMNNNETGFIQSDVHSIDNPEFFGNCIVVNGQTWPYHIVNRQRYRMRLLNGCNSRTLVLEFGQSKYPFAIIGTDGCVLDSKPVIVNSLSMMPGERYDVLFDFAQVNEPELILYNLGPDIPLNGTDDVPSDPETTGLVMKFIINPNKINDTTTPVEFLQLPSNKSGIFSNPNIRPNIRNLCVVEYDSNVVQVLADSEGNMLEDKNGNIKQYFSNDIIPEGYMPMPYGPIIALVGTYDVQNNVPNGLRWMQPITEFPLLNVPEIWRVYNTTGDAHPIHVHQVQFKILGREQIDPSVPLIAGAYPLPWENSRKDVVISYPGEILVIGVVFDKPGLYVWHCHMIDHEDNEIMRPVYVLSNPREEFDMNKINNLDAKHNNHCGCGHFCKCGSGCKCNAIIKCSPNCKCNFLLDKIKKNNHKQNNNVCEPDCGVGCMCGKNCMCNSNFKCNPNCKCGSKQESTCCGNKH